MNIDQAIENQELCIWHWTEEMKTNMNLLRKRSTSMKITRVQRLCRARRMKNIAETLEKEMEKLNKLYSMKDSGEEYV